MIFQLNKKYKYELTITPEIIDDFAKLSGDYSLIHMDKSFALSKNFQGRIAHGTILNIMLSNLIGMKLNTYDIMMLSQNIKYRQPIYENTKITLEAVIHHISEAVNIVEMKLKFLSDSNTIVANGKCQFKCL